MMIFLLFGSGLANLDPYLTWCHPCLKININHLSGPTWMHVENGCRVDYMVIVGYGWFENQHDMMIRTIYLSPTCFIHIGPCNFPYPRDPSYLHSGSQI